MVSPSSQSSQPSFGTTDRMFFGGFASGLNTSTIIDALTAAASRPIQIAQQRVGLLQNRQKALAQVNGSLSNLLSTLDGLRKPESGRGRIASLLDTANSTYLGVSAGTSAAVGSFTVDVVGVATSTTATSTAAVGQAVSQALPLDEAGLGLTPTAGTFTINSTVFTIPAATFTKLESSGAIGVAVSTSATLASAGLTLAPVSGTFVINGTSITYDASVDSLSAVISRINSSAAGVTASFDAGTQKFSLTRTDDGPTAITLSNTSGNFLEATNLVDNVNTKTGTETLGTNLISLGDVVTMINGAAIGVTASVVNDADGRPNLLNLTAATAISLGAGGDTSNFLAATHLLESPAGVTRTSVRNLGTVSPTAALASARLTTALTLSTGSFTINGVSISYDSAADSLNTMISRINTSGAGVTATYDAYTDKIRITSNSTGNAAIAMSDVTGNFLAATKVLAATQQAGANASYRINGGALQYSTTNDVTDAMPGMTLSLKQQTPSAVTVNVTSDANALKSKVNAFISQFNSTTAMLTDSTKYVEKGTSGTLTGDSTLRTLQATLRSLVSAPAVGNSTSLNSLEAIGISFGAVGTAAGQANTLVLDSAKFDNAFKTDPEGVVRLLSRFTGGATLDPSSTGSLLSISGTPTLVGDSGKYTITSATNGSLTVTFTPDNGNTPIVTTKTVSSGEVNTTLIPGMTLTFKGALVDGTDTLVISAAEEGVAKTLYEYVNTYTRSGGVMQGRDGELQARITDLNKQITRMQTRVDAKRESLIQRYAQLEVTMQRLQGQQSALNNFVSQISANKQSS